VRRAALCAAVAALLALPATAGDGFEELDRAHSDPGGRVYLDVGIHLFAPGLPEEDETADEEDGVYADVRKSEARFIPFHLKNTLVESGHWGAVTVLPSEAQAQDVNVFGEIVLSNGRSMVLEIQVVDATGRVWRHDRYKQLADELAYAPDALEQVDPLQSIYNHIANDMFESYGKLDAEELRTIREVSRLRFAVDLAPQAYGDYLSRTKKGRYVIERLPAENDPMIERLTAIRERDNALVDTLNAHYADFYDRMVYPYGEWRRISYDEEVQLRAIRKEARMQKIMGGLLILGGIAADGSSTAARVARDAAVIGGGIVLKNGFDKGKQAKIHVAALNELAASFDAEMAPLLVEVDGRVLKLEGSAEAQYAEWRHLLARILESEMALPQETDLNDPTSSAPSSPADAGP
jgi:hypothetical protein